MRLIDAGKNFEIAASGISENEDGPFGYEFSTAVVKYQIPYGYGAPATDSFSPYILGDASKVTSRLSDSLGQAIVEQTPEITSVALNYRVRVNYEGSAEILSPSMTVHYFDIYVIRVKCENSAISSGDFDLVCKNVGLQTISYGPYTVNSADAYISVGPGTDPEHVLLNLPSNSNVVFNLIIADVRVST
jgi:hypothetical protein